MTDTLTHLSDELVQELLDNRVLHSEIAVQLALNLLHERRAHRALRARCIDWARGIETKLDAIPIEELPDA